MAGQIIFICFKLAGALGLFMFGMQLASDGIQRAAGDRLQKTVNFMTGNRFISVVTGALITILIQSSSGASVMVVSFVNAGLLNLTQAIGVIMGANIGTTLTGWIIAAVGVKKFSIAIIAVPLFGIGFFFSLLRGSRVDFKSYGEGLMGFALIFLGLEYLAEAIPDPSGDALLFLQSISENRNLAIIVSVLVGVIFTMLINASSATIAITIGLAAKGIIDFEMAAAITLGANIGTTFDSFLVSLRANVNARRASWAHILFNVTGTVWVIIILRPFLVFVDAVTPGAVTPATMGAHIAMLHTMFNTVNTIVLLPFVRQYAKLLERFIRPKAGEEQQLKAYAPRALARVPELNLVQAQNDIAQMARTVEEMYSRFRADLMSPPSDMEAEIARFRNMEQYADSMLEGLSKFLIEVTEQDISEKTRENIRLMLGIIADLENVTDTCLNLGILIERASRKKLKIDAEELKKLEPYTGLVQEFLVFVKSNVNKPLSRENLSKAEDFERTIDASRVELKKLARHRLKAGAEVKTELLFIDIVRHVEKIGDFAYSISEALQELK